MDLFQNQQYINPEPVVDDLSTLRGKHRAEAEWCNDVAHSVLFVRRASMGAHYANIDQRIIPYLRRAGFYGVPQIGVINVDANLMTALVERWRPETHTFHLSVGEATITLQDIQLLTGLPIERHPVTGHLQYNWQILRNQLLGQMPPENVLKGHSIKMTWLSNTFNSLPAGATNYQIQCFTRVWILHCIGGLLCPSQANNYIHLMWLPLLEDLEEVGSYSWGSACLAWLYRELCRATRPNAHGVSGYQLLLQMWAWKRLPQFRPTFTQGFVLDQSRPYGYRWRSPINLSVINNKDVHVFRVDLDIQRDNEMEWQPYRDVMHLLPSFCTNGQGIWRAIVPLVCFHIIEWHHPDCCLRQFGMNQPIPSPPMIDNRVHSVDLRGNYDHNWETTFSNFIIEWDNRLNRVVTTAVLMEPLHIRSQYMQWYLLRTRQWITPVGVALRASVDAAERVYHHGGERVTSEAILGAVRAINRTSIDYPRQPVPDMVQFPQMNVPFDDFRQTRRSRRGMAERQTSVAFIPIPPGVNQVPPPISWPYNFQDSSIPFRMPSFSQPTFYDTQGGQSRCYDSEAGPLRLNVDLNVSISEAGTIPPFNIDGGLSETPQQDDFFD